MAMNRSSSPGTFTKSLNQDEASTQPNKNEAEVDAKIAKIRARNEALLKRQAEIEADRRSAEEKLASVTIRSQDSEEEIDSRHISREPMESPFPAKISPRTNPADEKPKVSMKDRLGTDPTTNIQQHIRNQRPSRNEKGDGPPPDPGYNFLADRMRDGGDSDEEKDKGHWGKDANMQNKNNLGNHRRGMPSNTGLSQQPGPSASSKGVNDSRRGRQGEDRQDRRVPYAGSNRDTGYQPHSGQSNYSKPANSRGHFDANSRDNFGTHGKEQRNPTSNASKGFAQARLERNKQDRSSSNRYTSQDVPQKPSPHNAYGHPDSSRNNRPTQRQGTGDTAWGNLQNTNNTAGGQTWAEEDHLNARKKRTERAQGWDDNSAFGSRSRVNPGQWDAGDKNRNSTDMSTRQWDRGEDLRNKINRKQNNREWDDADWDDGKTDHLVDRQGTRNNTDTTRRTDESGWGDADWKERDGDALGPNAPITRNASKDNSGTRRREVMSDYSNARDKPGQKPYENLKIQVQFDKKTMRGPRSPDQFDPKDDNRPLGAHERSSFQQKDRSANPSYPKKETKLNEKALDFKPSEKKISPAHTYNPPKPPQDNISNWQPMPENFQPLPNNLGSMNKNQSNSSWNATPTGDASSFQPVPLRMNTSDTSNNALQDTQHEFTIGEWQAPPNTSTQETSGAPNSSQQQQQTPEEDLHEQWIEVSRNWRESSAQSDWAEEVESQETSPTLGESTNMQWMPPTQTEPNQMLMTTPTEMYAMPPPNGSFVPSHQPNQPYQAEYFSYEQSMMQGPAMMTHSQPIPPPHHHGHNFPPSNILATMPSAHMIAPLHQIHPQQVHNVAAALTQITHAASHHNVPIMATHAQHAPPYMENTSRQSSYPIHQPYIEGGMPGAEIPPILGRGRGMYGAHERRGSFEHGLRKPGNTNDNYNDTTVSHKYSSTSSWRQPPEKDITKIPPRFQKQRPTASNPSRTSYSQRMSQRENEARRSSLPKTTEKFAPESATRLTIFGTSDVVNNLDEADMSDSLNGIPVRLIATKSLGDFREKIEMVDPTMDRFVLIHGLGEEAREVALTKEPGKTSDVDKGSISDRLAADFSDIIEDLINRIPYIQVSISTLLPRFDLEEQTGMSCSNNVRKVMNVEISSRFNGNSAIMFINNDLVLEWWKDDVKKKRLFCSDGYNLTAYGFSVMLDHWMVKLKKVVNDSKISSSTHSYSNEPKGEGSSDSPISFNNPEPCLDRLTENIPKMQLHTRCSSNLNNESNENIEAYDSPRTSIDHLGLKSATDSDEKTDGNDVFHDASETITDEQTINNPISIETSPVSPAEENHANVMRKTKKDEVVASEEIKVSSETNLQTEADETDESFHEKANEEVMEKDLPDNAETN